PELVGVHLAETLVALDAQALASALVHVLPDVVDRADLRLAAALVALVVELDGDEGRLAQGADVAVDLLQLRDLAAVEEVEIEPRRPRAHAGASGDLDAVPAVLGVVLVARRQREEVRIELSDRALELLHLLFEPRLVGQRARVER